MPNDSLFLVSDITAMRKWPLFLTPIFGGEVRENGAFNAKWSLSKSMFFFDSVRFLGCLHTRAATHNNTVMGDHQIAQNHLNFICFFRSLFLCSPVVPRCNHYTCRYASRLSILPYAHTQIARNCNRRVVAATHCRRRGKEMVRSRLNCQCMSPIVRYRWLAR